MDASEQGAVLELLGMMLHQPRFIALLALLAIGIACDVRTRRIPNRLVLAGLLIGLGLQLASPAFHRSGLLWPMAGIAVGGGILLPLHALRMLGAGDVKLMAMVGAFMGPMLVARVCLWTVIAGGGIALLHVLRHRTVARLRANLRMLLLEAVFDVAAGTAPRPRLTQERSAGQLPYAVAIGVASVAVLIADQLGIA